MTELAQALAFLESLGLEVERVDGPVHGFIPGVAICAGRLRVGSNASVDGLLHEAGHLALTPKPFRCWMDGDVSDGQRRMLEAVAHLDPDVGIARHALQSSDPEATAWAFAAGRAIGLPDAMTIADDSYQGEGAGIRAMCAAGAYVGIRGLVAAGLCVHGLAARRAGQVPYPAMRAWVQDGPYPEWLPEEPAADRSCVPRPARPCL